MKITLLALVPLLAVAKPAIDDAHDRVQTTLDPKMDRIGTLVPRTAKEIGPTRLAIGCEMLPRGYGEFENFKEYLPPLGIARVRLHAGWAKLEPRPGEWDFSWLDRQVNWLVENGLEPILETSYGNPAYPGAGGPSLSDGLPTGEVAQVAWDRFVDRLASHYPQVKNWACWNEPNNIRENTPEDLADNNIRTATIIRRRIPDAKIGMLVLSWPDLAYTKACFKVFKERNALRLFHWAIMHDYSPNPDSYYKRVCDPWVAYIRKEAPHLRIWNGESGATSDPHFSAPISSMKWNSELTQAKWDARRLVADLAHGFDSLVFTIADPCYDSPERYCNYVPPYWVRTRSDRFMKRMGLVKCNDRLEVVKVKPAYYAVQNVATLFDATIEPEGMQTGRALMRPRRWKVGLVFGERADGLAVYAFCQKGTGIPLIAFWNAANRPTNENVTGSVSFEMTGAAFEEPVWIDLVTGAIYEVPKRMAIPKGGGGMVLEEVPYYDAPAVITERRLAIRP